LLVGQVLKKLFLACSEMIYRKVVLAWIHGYSDLKLIFKGVENEMQIEAYGCGNFFHTVFVQHVGCCGIGTW